MPDVVIGHSIGEFVAACVAGVMSLEDALALVAERGRLMGALPRDGAMQAIFAEEDTVVAKVDRFDRVSIAAINGPSSTVISGDTAQVAEIVAELEAEGTKTKALTVSHAFHSPLMSPILDEFEAKARTVAFRSPQIPVVSNATGAMEQERLLDPTYWRDQHSGAVRFYDGMKTLEAEG